MGENQALLAAAADMRFLLGRGYPRERVLTLVGDRHALRAPERELLRRGVFAPQAARARKKRLLGISRIRGQRVALDGHNLLLTLEAALKGGRLVLGDDGVVRDISRQGRNHRPGPLTLKATGLILDALRPAGEILFYLDAPLSKSGQLAAQLRGLLAQAGLKGDAQAVPVPERQLVVHSGPDRKSVV